jgi:uncharacterized protein (TIGR02246 family)
MNRRAMCLVIGLAVLFLSVGFMTAEDNKLKIDPKREADAQAIRKLGQEYVAAYEKGDAKACASFWTNEGEFIADDGQVTEGKAAIEKSYAELFAKKEVRKLEMEVSTLKFPSTDTAVLESTLRRKNAEGEVIASSWNHALLVREGGQWKVAMVREWDRDISHDTKLADLSWMIGSWSATNKEKEVSLNYEWDDKKAFIKGQFSIKEGGKVVETGTQMIGKDNSVGLIRSWVFNSEGGFGGGNWYRDGNKWTVDTAGVLPDGREATSSTIYIKLGPNEFTWQSVDRTLAGEPMPDTPPIKVTRQKTGK